MSEYKSFGIGDLVDWDTGVEKDRYRIAYLHQTGPYATVRHLASGVELTAPTLDLTLVERHGPKAETLVLDGSDPFDNALIGIVKTNRAKRKDYTSGDAGIFENFERAADEVKLTVDQVISVLIAIKNARLRALLGREDEAVHESIEDTILDRTVYCAILRAWRLQQEEK